MHTHCLYCGHTLGGPSGIRSVRQAVRLAFDPERARVWSICDRCHGWNLWPKAQRSQALQSLEREARDQARVLFETDNVALLDSGTRQLVRVGPAPRREAAWWRYGRRLRRRRVRFRSPVTRVATATYSAVSSVGMSVGLASVTGDFTRAVDRSVEILRWRRFGGIAWAGRAPCPNCGSVLIRLFFLTCSDLILVAGPDGEPELRMPCSRCDAPLSTETHRFVMSDWEPLLRRVLAWHNIDGATGRELDRAVSLIEAAGSARAFIGDIAGERFSLYDMGHVERLALEVAVNDRAERARLALDAMALDAGWCRAEELAAIMDEEL